jgi:hypothetical protein
MGGLRDNLWQGQTKKFGTKDNSVIAIQIYLYMDSITIMLSIVQQEMKEVAEYQTILTVVY